MKFKKFFQISGGLFFLFISFLILRNELKNIQISELIFLMHTFSKTRMLFAFLFLFLSYFLMAEYEHLAVHYAGKNISFKKIIIPSTLSHAIANVSGFPLLSGAPLRYRFYSFLDFKPKEIAKTIYFVIISNGLGLIFLLGIFILGFKSPSAQFNFLSLPLRILLGSSFLILVFFYLKRSFSTNNHFRLFKFKIDCPDSKTALKQFLFSTLDWLLIALVFFILLPGQNHFSLFNFFAIFFIAQGIGSLSQVPGGFGVFDTTILLLLKAHGFSSSIVLVALFLFRFIYYILPLFFAIFLLIIVETKQHLKKKTPNDC